MELIKQIVFVSTATLDLDGNALSLLKEQCAKNNLAASITGILLYKKRNFISVLEGYPEDIQRVFFDKVLFDHRHRSIDVLREHEHTTRMFSQWSMQYQWLQVVGKEQPSHWQQAIYQSTEPVTLPAEHAETRYILECFCAQKNAGICNG